VYALTPLTEAMDLEDFSCGQLALDEWLRTSALRTRAKRVAATYVWLSANSNRVVAYATISPTSISATGLPPRASTGLREVPGYLLARLALDASLQGSGLGATLLAQALTVICHLATIGGGRVIVVDPIDASATEFYRHFGFVSMSEGTRLYLKVSTARAIIAGDDDA
jgi:predicted GNAT family N-acyltransferase